MIVETSTLAVLSLSYRGRRSRLLTSIFSVRIPASISLTSRSLKAFTLHTKDMRCTLHPCVSRREIISSTIACSCMTQQNTMCSITEHLMKLFRGKHIFCNAISLVSSVTWKGCMSQHPITIKKYAIVQNCCFIYQHRGEHHQCNRPRAVMCLLSTQEIQTFVRRT